VAGKMNEAVSIAIKGLFHISLSSSLLDHHDNGQTGEHRCPPMFGSSKDNLPFVDMVLTNLHRSSAARFAAFRNLDFISPPCNRRKWALSGVVVTTDVTKQMAGQELVLHRGPRPN